MRIYLKNIFTTTSTTALTFTSKPDGKSIFASLAVENFTDDALSVSEPARRSEASKLSVSNKTSFSFGTFFFNTDADTALNTSNTLSTFLSIYENKNKKCNMCQLQKTIPPVF